MRCIGIAGAGFSGAVIARQLADSGLYKVIVFDERNHVGGNCHTKRDIETGVMVHEYGPHIFHTDREEVWIYLNRWGVIAPYINRVKAITSRGVFSLPINLLTINQFFGKTMGPLEASEFVSHLGYSTDCEPDNFEEQGLKFLGRDLYENFFHGYTKKQWGVNPKKLPASILRRLPVRFTYDDNYYSSKYQGIPVDGYTSIIKNILDHPNINVRLGESFNPVSKKDFFFVFWSGSLDSFYRYDLGRLRYRTLDFERFTSEGNYQGNAVINYCDEKTPYTRITEHKHFAPHETHQRTICFREFSRGADPGDIPYYPLHLDGDTHLLEAYTKRAQTEKNVRFIGRLGTYRYLDMDAVIGESLTIGAEFLNQNRH